MNGQLSEHPLSELIHEACARGLSGSLRLQHENSKIVVYVEDGKVVYVASNLRNFRLAEYIKKHGLLSEEQLASFADKQSDLALADALSADLLIRREDLAPLVRSLSTDALRLALLWTDGSWEFDERTRLSNAISEAVEKEPLLLEWSRRAYSQLATERFADPDELISPGAESSATSFLTPGEGFLLSRVEGEIRLNDLVALSGMPEANALQAIYGLTLAGFLNRTHKQNVLAGQPKRSIAKPKPVVVQAPVVPKRSEEEELKDFLSRMDAAVSYYDVLNVNSEASANEIKQAYYGVARKYHPDRFRGQAEIQLHARLESEFARITQAYETLMDSSRRRAHDAKLAAQEKAKRFARAAPQAVAPAAKQPGESSSDAAASKETDTERAEQSFKEGFAALQQGQINLALGLLSAAARAVPDESRYRAYYGRALATVEKTRRSAEAELQAAVRLDSSNATYHVMLAELYSDLGFARRALSEAERAVALDPNNRDARDLVRKLK